MLEVSRGPYKIAWRIRVQTWHSKMHLSEFDPIGVILWRVYQSLYWFPHNRMKLSELVGLAPVSITVGSKKIANLVKVFKWGYKVGPPSQIGPYLAPLLQMWEVWKFYHRCHCLRWPFFVADVFSPWVLFSGKNSTENANFWRFLGCDISMKYKQNFNFY